MANIPIIENHEKSRELFTKATKIIPSGIYGHLGPAEGQFIPVSNWPLFAAKAKGSYIWDVDGNKYIDYMCAYGPNVLGYNDPDVDAAAMKQMEAGNCTTTPMSVTVDCADLLVDTVASADWAFFAKNGNDATQGAMMAARAFSSADLEGLSNSMNRLICFLKHSILLSMVSTVIMVLRSVRPEGSP